MRVSGLAGYASQPQASVVMAGHGIHDGADVSALPPGPCWRCLSASPSPASVWRCLDAWLPAGYATRDSACFRRFLRRDSTSWLVAQQGSRITGNAAASAGAGGRLDDTMAIVLGSWELGRRASDTGRGETAGVRTRHYVLREHVPVPTTGPPAHSETQDYSPRPPLAPAAAARGCWQSPSTWLPFVLHVGRRIIAHISRPERVLEFIVCVSACGMQRTRRSAIRPAHCLASGARRQDKQTTDRQRHARVSHGDGLARQAPPARRPLVAPLSPGLACRAM